MKLIIAHLSNDAFASVRNELLDLEELHAAAPVDQVFPDDPRWDTISQAGC